MKSARARFKRCLASGVTLSIAILPTLVEPDARPVVDAYLSQHFSNSGPVYDGLRIRYFLDDTGASPYRDGDVYHMPIPFTLGQWTLHTFDVAADAAAGFPGMDPEDNSLNHVLIGLESRNGALCAASFDALTISKGLTGEASMQKHRDLLALQEAKVPGIRQLQGLEVSYIQHLNEFSVDTLLPDYDQMMALSGLADPSGWISDQAALEDFMASYSVDQVHARGGLMSFNHAFGTDGLPSGLTREQLRDEMVANKAYGSDLLEVGYRFRGGHSLGDFLWLWDELANQGLYLLGVGTSDTHGGPVGHWATMQNNFVSWIYATATGKAELLEGMKAGRIYFGDRTLFNGTMDFRSSDGFLMGQIVVTDKVAETLTFQLDGMELRDRVLLIKSGALHQTVKVTAPNMLKQLTLPIDASPGSFYRLELYSRKAEAKAFSNPIYFVRSVPAGGIRPEQAAIALGGVHSTLFDAFTLEQAAFSPAGSGGTLTLGGTAVNGAVALDYGTIPPLVQVSFSGGLAGAWAWNGTVLELTNLNGSGEVEIVH